MKKFNIWRIRSRWTRAAVAWLICPPLLAFLLIGNLVSATAKAAEEFWHELTWRDWPNLVRPIFRAMLARDAA